MSNPIEDKDIETIVKNELSTLTCQLNFDVAASNPFQTVIGIDSDGEPLVMGNPDTKDYSFYNAPPTSVTLLRSNGEEVMTADFHDSRASLAQQGEGITYRGTADVPGTSTGLKVSVTDRGDHFTGACRGITDKRDEGGQVRMQTTQFIKTHGLGS